MALSNTFNLLVVDLPHLSTQQTGEQWYQCAFLFHYDRTSVSFERYFISKLYNHQSYDEPVRNEWVCMSYSLSCFFFFFFCSGLYFVNLHHFKRIGFFFTVCSGVYKRCRERPESLMARISSLAFNPVCLYYPFCTIKHNSSA